MKFPAWVNQPPKQTTKERAKKRLTYIMRNAALQIDGRPSYRSLANALGIAHGTICNYVDRGHFSIPMAKAIEKLVGREVAPFELLVDPLSKDHQ